jgi:hypothetical protein
VEVWRKVTTKYGAYVQIAYATMMLKKNSIVVNLALLIFAVIVIRVLAVQLTNYILTPKVGNCYSRYQKTLVTDDHGGVYEQMEYNQVKVYKVTNDSVFYSVTMYNGKNCNDSGSASKIEFAEIYN